MNRRGFLRALSAVGATALLPIPAFTLAEAGIVIPNMPIELGAIRALGQYDVECDRFVVRLDAFNRDSNQQFHVDFWVPHSLVKPSGMRAEYLESRLAAEEVLKNHMRHNGWRADQLAPLPIPLGYVEPTWMRPNG